MSEIRIIKKYPNRRLYDTALSKYITLEDVRELVMVQTKFAVIDKKTGADITRNILLQIIIEQEEDGEPIFTAEALQKIISFYGNSVEGLASNFLERSLTMFGEQQDALRKQMTSAVLENPVTSIAEMAQRNMDTWQKMQEDFLRAAGLAPSADKKD
jgi:polyhydroxyalkanoate synthesis repressor PhaR